MREYLKFYIDGQWVDPVEPKTSEVINPATEAVSGRISMGSAADADKAVSAARKAFSSSRPFSKRLAPPSEPGTPAYPPTTERMAKMTSGPSMTGGLS